MHRVRVERADLGVDIGDGIAILRNRHRIVGDILHVHRNCRTVAGNRLVGREQLAAVHGFGRAGRQRTVREIVDPGSVRPGQADRCPSAVAVEYRAVVQHAQIGFEHGNRSPVVPDRRAVRQHGRPVGAHRLVGIEQLAAVDGVGRSGREGPVCHVGDEGSARAQQRELSLGAIVILHGILLEQADLRPNGRDGIAILRDGHRIVRNILAVDDIRSRTGGDLLVGIEQLAAVHRLGRSGRQRSVGQIGNDRARCTGQLDLCSRRVGIVDRQTGQHRQIGLDGQHLAIIGGVRRLNPGGDIGQQPFRAGAAERNRPGAIRHRVRADGNAAGCRHGCPPSQRHGIVRTDRCQRIVSDRQRGNFCGRRSRPVCPQPGDLIAANRNSGRGIERIGLCRCLAVIGRANQRPVESDGLQCYVVAGRRGGEQAGDIDIETGQDPADQRQPQDGICRILDRLDRSGQHRIQYARDHGRGKAYTATHADDLGLSVRGQLDCQSQGRTAGGIYGIADTTVTDTLVYGVRDNANFIIIHKISSR